MAKIRNVSGEDRLVPALGYRLVLAGQVVDCPDDEVFGYTCQAVNWSPADDAATAAHKKGDREQRRRENPGELTQPARNASQQAWQDWVVDAGLATDSDVANLSRDELVTNYGPPSEPSNTNAIPVDGEPQNSEG